MRTNFLLIAIIAGISSAAIAQPSLDKIRRAIESFKPPTPSQTPSKQPNEPAASSPSSNGTQNASAASDASVDPEVLRAKVVDIKRNRPTGAFRGGDFIANFTAINIPQRGSSDIVKLSRRAGDKCDDWPECNDNVRPPRANIKIPANAMTLAEIAIQSIPVSQILNQKYDPLSLANLSFRAINLPIGYTYCTAYVQVRGVKPGHTSGPLATHFRVTPEVSGLLLESDTRDNFQDDQTGERRIASVDAYIYLVGVAEDKAEKAYASGQCFRPVATRAIISCYGDQCRSASDIGQSK